MNSQTATDCRHFNGYKPCGRIDSQSENCGSQCHSYEKSAATDGTKVLVVHLGALGAVLRSTALLPAIKRKYPQSHITWITDKPGDQVLLGNPFVDRVLTTNMTDLLRLRSLSFDVALVIDKSMEATGILRFCEAPNASSLKVFGFITSPETGAVEPATPAAKELWDIGISNRAKFDLNRKTENQLVHEALELGPYTRDEYVLQLSSQELQKAQSRRAIWSDAGKRKLIGINTGCASTISAKKLSIEGHISLMKELATQMARHSNPQNISFVLLGGREDTQRNQTIANKASGLGIPVIQSPTEDGIRDGMASVEAVDIVVSGDSFGLHMAIGLKKKTIAWFGPTCAHEIDLYGRGDVILTLAGCSPCWKRTCSMSPMCFDLVDFRRMAQMTLERLMGVPRLNVSALEVSP